ncbi:response regulator [Dokdonia sinensis]|uniref:histidine kinase n=1 Tax=Dokdonia sinensis TaxID=2479847 RepID=A0A3M0G2D3_9FLAO|nr:response regulator [Dokdonia sinensis]RMB59110.1 response regulator [Dokdonia sinensis]
MKHNLLIIIFLLCFTSALKTTAQQRTISKDSLESLSDIIIDHRDDLDYKGAIETAALLISNAKDSKQKFYEFLGYDQLGTIYTELKDTLQARLSYEKALGIARETKADSLLSWSYVSLGNVESDQKENYQKGIDYYEKSIAINDANNKQNQNLIPYLNIGWTYLDENQEDKALYFLLKAKNLATQDTLNYRTQVNVKTLLGRYNIKKGNYTLADELLNEAATLVEKYNCVYEGSEVYRYYAQLEEARGNYKKAYSYLKKNKELDARIYESDKLSEIQIASAQFKIEQYERTIATAEKESQFAEELVKKSKQLNYIFIAASLILLGALIGIYFAFKSRKKYIKRLHEKNNQLMAAKDSAERLSKLKTQFFSTVSHELRTPLYGVIGIASILLEDNTIKTHQDDLKSLKFSADYLLALINDVLLINKMDANGIKLEHTPFRLSTLTKSITRSFEFSLEQNKNKIHLAIDKNVPNKLIGDSVRLSQILMNLIGNAIKFNENGNIWVNIDLIDKTPSGLYRTQFTVKDDGIGIPASKHQSIFEEFSQVENRNYNYQGTGLGLPIVKKLLTLHDSEINLDSSVGKGSTFSFILNLEADASVNMEVHMGAPLQDLENHTIHSLKTVHILVVDDNRINQKITQKILEKRKFKCSLANDGEEAIALVQEQNYDLILMDIHMPKIDGIQATKVIRKFDKTTPIVALTAVEMDEMRATIMNSGMNDIILKPYDISQFLTIILRNLNAAFAKADS